MKTTIISATKARNNFFELINLVSMGGSFIIEKDKKEVALILPKKKKLDLLGIKKASDICSGILKDFNLSDSPLRNKKMYPSIGKWDKRLE